MAGGTHGTWHMARGNYAMAWRGMGLTYCVRYPGIEEKVEMANYVADGPVEQTMMLPGTKQEQKKETNVEKAEGQEFEVKDAREYRDALRLF